MKNVTKRVLTTVAALCVALAVCGPVRALQPTLGGLEDLVVKDNLDAADAQRVKAYAAQHLASLEGEPEKVREGRQALVSALMRSPRVSVRFRLALSEEVVAKLGAMVKKSDQRELVVVNAVRVAGELGTSNALSLVRDAMKDQRAAVRYAAVYALGRTLDAVGRHPPAVQPGEVLSAVEALGQVAADDADLHVADGAVVALTMTLGARTDGVGLGTGALAAKELKSRAVTAVATAGKAQAGKLAAGESIRLAVLVRCLSTARAALSQFNSSGEVELNAPAVKDLAGLCGDAAAALARLSAGGETGVSASLMSQCAGLIETVFSLACGATNVQPGPMTLQAAVKAGDAAGVKREATRIVDKLAGAPFSLPRERFELPN